jgi:ubiquinone/menaquinone biosynthesis C-methylase UbiE
MLNNSQYSSSKKYEARIYLSRKFKANHKSKYEWIFDHFPKHENLNVLELGCGTGLFWLANRNNLIKSWSIILSDYSEGMLEATRNSLSRLNYNFKYEIVNAEDIKFFDKTFDIILANNMLYHIQNRSAAINNIGRILKDTGVFIAATMGRNDILELHNHLYAFLESKNNEPPHLTAASAQICGGVLNPTENKFRFREYSFSLDNGMEQLKKYFQNIVLERYDNKLVIHEVDAIVNYYLSFNGIYDNGLVR